MTTITPSSINQYIRDNASEERLLENILDYADLSCDYVLDTDTQSIIVLPVFMVDRFDPNVLKDLFEYHHCRWLYYYRKYKHELTHEYNDTELIIMDAFMDIITKADDSEELDEERSDYIGELFDYASDIGVIFT